MCSKIAAMTALVTGGYCSRPGSAAVGLPVCRRDAGCHEVVWLVGSSNRGKAPVAPVGPAPGTTGIPIGPFVPLPVPAAVPGMVPGTAGTAEAPGAVPLPIAGARAGAVVDGSGPIGRRAGAGLMPVGAVPAPI